MQFQDENAGLRGEVESRKVVGGKSRGEEADKQENRGLHVKGVCLRVVSNSTFETWSQLYESSEIYQKTEPQKSESEQKSEFEQKSESEQNSDKKQLVERKWSSERLLGDCVQPTKCRNKLESENVNQSDYYNFQIISQV